MSNTILIYGESGTGKSTSIRNLDSKKTFIITPINKTLPFRGYKSQYLPFLNGEGNYLINDNCNEIIKTLNFISNNRPEINIIIIDDFQYIMSNQFMRRALEKGWEKYTEIGESTWRVIEQSMKLRNDLKVFFLSHSETQDGKTKLKTIGKILDEKICLEGMFTIVLNSMIVDSKYVFLTQNNSYNIAKSPIGMFDKLTIPNDLSIVIKSIDDYELKDEKNSYDLMIEQLKNQTNIEDLRKKTIELCKNLKRQGFTEIFIESIKEHATTLSETFNKKEEKENAIQK